MVWAPLLIEGGDRVETPQGTGMVRRVSESNKTAQVDVNGQLFEVPLESIKKLEGGTPAGTPEGGNNTPMPEQARPVRPWRVKPGDRVQTKSGDRKGEVSEVTQRTVRVKFDDGKTEAYPKQKVSQHLDYEQQQGKPEPGQDEQPEQKPEQEKQDEKQQPKEPVTPEQAGDVVYDLMRLKDHLEKKIDDSVDGELEQLRNLAKSTQTLEVKVGEETNVVTGLKHKQLEQLIRYAALRLSPLLVGMAGTGKTHAGQQAAEALGLQFYSMSVGAQTSKTDIMGYMDATGKYVQTHFRQAYEHGGVFLMDEIDAGNANVLITINAALSNGLAAFPDAMVEQHQDFVFIASANTFGNGANRQYVGRNQLDAATLDRFAVIEWFIDDELEANLTTGLNGKAWYMAVRACRDYVAEKNIRALVSPRATQKGSKLLHIGQDLDEVIQATILGSVPDDKKADVTEVAKTVFNKFASDVPSQISKAVNPEVSELLR